MLRAGAPCNLFVSAWTNIVNWATITAEEKGQAGTLRLAE